MTDLMGKARAMLAHRVASDKTAFGNDLAAAVLSAGEELRGLAERLHNRVINDQWADDVLKLSAAVLRHFGPKERKRVEGWVSIYPTHSPRGLWKTRDEAMRVSVPIGHLSGAANEQPIAAVFVKGTEGEES